MNEYPKMLYSQKGWDDLNDCKMVFSVAEEETARADGYSELGNQKSDITHMPADKNEAAEYVEAKTRRGRPRKEGA